jgi:formate dehydrogenase major subunit
LWPKTNGDHHIEMFRKMAAGTITACYVMGQNPAVTEPNQGAVREGLRNLNLLVVQDVFETETAACDRKAGGVTILLPSAMYVEKGGSATNSGRTLQWRYKAKDPAGNSRADLEYIFRFAAAVDAEGGFSHIEDVWRDLEFKGWAPAAEGDSVYSVVFAGQYGYTPAVGARIDSETVAESIYKQMCTNCQNAGGIVDGVDGGTVWIYTQGYQGGALVNNLPALPAGALVDGNDGLWKNANRAKSRDNFNYGGVFGYQRWGFSWLVNRRVLYNGGEINNGAGGLLDNSDGFQRPEGIASLFATRHAASTWPAGAAVVDYARGNYRFYHKLADRAITTAPGHVEGFPFHVEPYETPHDGATAGKANFVATYGYNSTNGSSRNLLPTTAYGSVPATPMGSSANFPLTLTTIRCVEHFQGGPITRNNHWNVELEPEPWIELNSADARTYGIKDGDLVKVVTARTEDLAGDTIESATLPRATYGDGFRARVGVGLKDNQRVGAGVVAIPWHWGERGLSTGSRANDLCIDASDANTQIPEYKVCLCRIEKI